MRDDGLDSLGFCNKREVYSGRRPCSSPYAVYDAYKNVCTLAYVIEFDDQETEDGMKFVYGVIFPILSLLVLNTNGIVVLILWAQRRKCSRKSLMEPLFWMAVAAVCMALSPLPFTIYFYNLDHVNDLQHSEELCHLHKIAMEVLPFFFNTIITFLTLLLGVQRFIAVQFPLRSFDWCSRRISRGAMKFAILIALSLTSFSYATDDRILLHFCVDAFSDIHQQVWVARCFIARTPLQLWLGVGRLSSVLSLLRLSLNVVPSLTLVIVTFLLIRTLRDTRVSELSKHRHTTGKTSQSTSKTTLMLTVIIVLFLIARLPSTCLLLLNQLSVSFPVFANSFNFTSNHYLLAASNITILAVHPLTFAVYILMSRRFRISLLLLLSWRRSKSDSACHIHSNSRKHTPLPRNCRSSLAFGDNNNRVVNGRRSIQVSLSVDNTTRKASMPARQISTTRDEFVEHEEDSCVGERPGVKDEC